MARSVAHRPPGPHGVADEVAADLVGDAGQRDERLLHLLALQRLPVDLDLTVDHAGDLELPLVGVDARDDDGGVDAVEVGVRDDVGGQARQPQVGAGGDGQLRALERSALQGVARHRRCRGAAPEQAAGVCRHRTDRSPDEPAPAGVRGARCARRRCRGATEEPQAGGGAEDRRQDVRRARTWAAEHRCRTDEADDGEDDEPGDETTAGQDADGGTRQRQHEDGPDEQGPLVVGAERRDGEVLEPRRRPVDEGSPDRCDRRRLSRGLPHGREH